ncbi:MAG: 50S ribosomal protein L3 [Patescibacteria group bacterium]
MKVILGKKLNMSQVFQADGSVAPVTLVEAGPCTVTEVKEATVAIGFGKGKHVAKAQLGIWKELGAFAEVREFPKGKADVKRGDIIDVSAFAVGDHVDVTGTSKGHGFQGVVKRHKFAGGPASHGHKDNLRMPGSIGAGGVQRVFKGMRMAGRMGGDRVTVKNLQVMSIDPVKNVLAIKGALPGAFGSLIAIRARDGKTIWTN